MKRGARDDATEVVSGERRSWLFGIAFVIGLLIALGPLVRLVALGEMFPQVGIALAAKPPLYGRIYYDHPNYKLEQWSRRRPRVVAFGSSRVMQLREAAFARCGAGCFYNAGGAAPMPETALQVLRALPDQAWPQLMLFGIDLWAVNPKFSETMESVALQSPDPIRVIEREFNFGVNTLLEAREDRLLTNILIGRERLATIPYARIGLIAHLKTEGFRPDGSYLLFDRSDVRPDDDRFLADARARHARFTVAARPDPARVQQMKEILEIARAHNTRVIGFLPPFSDAIVEVLHTDPAQLQYVNSLNSALSTLFGEYGAPIRDFTTLGSANCVPNDSIDGIHPTEACMARIVLALARDPQARPILAPYVDPNALAALLAASPQPYLGETF